MKQHLNLLIVVLSVGMGFSLRAQTLPPLEQGKAAFQMQQWPEAEAAFRAAVQEDPKSALAYLWLGRVLTAQQNYKEAENALKSAVKHDKTLSDAYLELAKIYLATDEKKDARKVLDQAEKLDPNNPELYYRRGMAYGDIRLAELRRGKVKEEFGIRRTAFLRAIELKSDHPDAYYQLGQAYENAMNDLDQAVDHYARQIAITPDHVPSLKALVAAFIRSRQFDRGMDLFSRLLSTHQSGDARVLEGYAAQLKAYRYHSKGLFAEALQAFETYLATLDATDPEEASLYRSLSLVAPADVADQYNKATPKERNALWASFWTARDPDPTTATNERLIEHYRRIMYARLTFSEGKSPWDRRGEIYIRYGDPHDRQRFLMRSGEEAAENYFPTGNTMVDVIRERNREQYKMQVNTGGTSWSQDPIAEEMTRQTQALAFAVESWVYVPFGLELFFADQMHSGKFDFPTDTMEMPSAGTASGAVVTKRLAYQMFTNPKKQADLLIQQAPEAYRFEYGGEPLAFVYDVVSFKGTSGKTEVEVAYSIPSNQLGSSEDGRGMETWFNTRMSLRDGSLNHVAATASLAGPIARPLSSKDRPELQTTTFQFEAEPGVYRTALAIQDSISRRIGIFESPVTLSDYSGSALQLSDIRLASTIDAADGTGGFVRHKLKILPYPARLYPQGAPVYLYYEVYNLTPDAGGQTAFQTQVEITAKEEQQNVAWRLLSNLGRLITRSSDEKSILLTFEDGGVTADDYKYTSIDTNGSPAGRYVLTLTVTDMRSGQHVAKSREFVIVKN